MAKVGADRTWPNMIFISKIENTTENQNKNSFENRGPSSLQYPTLFNRGNIETKTARNKIKIEMKTAKEPGRNQNKN